MMPRRTEVPHFGNYLQKTMVPVWVLLGLLISGVGYAGGQAPGLSVDNAIASAGFFRLSWETSAKRVELQVASSSDFQNPATAYIGPDRATVISGKPDGTLYYRVRAVSTPSAGPWSKPVTVEVRHHSLARALMFLSLGILVFSITAIVIVRGSVKAK
jgi:hypothetical protein